MTGRFRSFVSKAAALTILAALLFAVWAIAVEPLAARVATAEAQLAENRRLLGALVERARQLRESNAVAATANADPALSSVMLLEGASSAQMTAALQSRIADAASAAGAMVVSTGIAPDRQQGAVRLAAIEAVLKAEIGPLERFLLDLETGSPTLVVLSLDVARSPAPETPPRETALDVRIVVAAGVAEASAAAAVIENSGDAPLDETAVDALDMAPDAPQDLGVDP
ncbi:MAG: type II secretion system protein GspM [Hyphomicrobium sp.]|nr:type II secretion system protein GspM [Hyphomicrobium sp.]